MFSFDKQPWEEETRAVDVSGWAAMQRGETISTATVTVSLNGVVQPAMLVNSSVSGRIILFRVRGGAHGNSYKINIRVTTSLGHQREIDVMLHVIEF